MTLTRLRRLRLSASLSMFLALVACSALHAATPGLQITLAEGSGTTTLVGISENPDGSLWLDAEQTGVLRPYGEFDGFFAYTAYIDEARGLTFLVGNGTFVFANGDELYLTARIVQFGTDYPKPFVGVLHATGGTGRFAGASGFLEIDGVDGEDFTDPIHLSGVIATPRRKK